MARGNGLNNTSPPVIARAHNVTFTFFDEKGTRISVPRVNANYDKEKQAAFCNQMVNMVYSRNGISGICGSGIFIPIGFLEGELQHGRFGKI
jgi:hypothetical protein